MVNIPFVPILVAGVSWDGRRYCLKEDTLHEQRQKSFRAARLVDDSTRVLIVTFPSLNIWDRSCRKAVTSLLEEWQEHGANIRGSRYAWLGYSDNHVKGGKVVLFREDEEWSASSVLDAFGNVYEVFTKNGYGKYAARIGLSFSSTVDALDVGNTRTVLMEDLRAPDGSLHTDGCGLIRGSFAREICAMFNLPLDTSVFQIRRGGFKGLLISYPDKDFEFLCKSQNKLLDNRRVGPDIVLAFRKSMLKYEGGPTMLELNDHSARPGHARLNETFILLLLTNGVRLEVFRKLLLDQLALIGAVANDRDKALKAVGGELDASSTAFHQELYTMLLANHDLTEPYMAVKLKQFQQSQYNALHDKLNIAVDSSVYLFGVVDEYGVLGPDEVFVNIPGWTGVITKPKVVVGRNPSYSPGDLRVFKAVYHEKLAHLNNCIVFSRQARHSVPDTMASGDLDGDTYLVIWDSELVPPNVPPYEQRTASSSGSLSSSQEPGQRTPEDFKRAAVETFLDHHHNLLLRSMANEWKRRATHSPDLANDEIARKLQPLVESALDAMKSGTDVRSLQRQFREITRAPSKNHDGFKCPLESLRELVPLDGGFSSRMTEFHCDETLIIREQDVDMWEKCFNEAPEALREFNKALSGAIDLDHEWKEQHGDSDKSRGQTRAPRHAELVTEKYRIRWFGGGTFAQMYLQRMRASAWYCYGYSVGRQAFAWLGIRYLNEIRAVWTNGGRPVDYVGATCPLALLSPAPSMDNTQSSQQSTLVADEAVDIEDPENSTPPQAINRGPNRRTAFVNAARDDELSVAKNPKPTDPVATDLPHCKAGIKHEWDRRGSRSYLRAFKCKVCGIKCKERDMDGRWQADPGWAPTPAVSQGSLEDGETVLMSDLDSLRSRRSAAVGASLASDDSSPSSSSPEAMSVDDEDDFDAMHSPPFSALTPTSRITFRTRKPIRINATRPPTRHSEDISPQIPSSCQPTLHEDLSDCVTMPGGIPPSSQVGSLSDLVHENEKPTEPVARDHAKIVHESCPSHGWHLRWAGRGYRHYECICGLIVKEKKVDGRWVAYNVRR